MKEELIVCAALKSGSTVVCGVRHFDRDMSDLIIKAELRNRDWEHGFMTNKHRFLDRREALALAQANGQLKGDRRAKLPELYSEDIY